MLCFVFADNDKSVLAIVIFAFKPIVQTLPSVLTNSTQSVSIPIVFWTFNVWISLTKKILNHFEKMKLFTKSRISNANSEMDVLIFANELIYQIIDNALVCERKRRGLQAKIDIKNAIWISCYFLQKLLLFVKR